MAWRAARSAGNVFLPPGTQGTTSGVAVEGKCSAEWSGVIPNSPQLGDSYGQRQAPLEWFDRVPWNRQGCEGTSLCRCKMRVGVLVPKIKILTCGKCRPHLACGAPAALVPTSSTTALERRCRADPPGKGRAKLCRRIPHGTGDGQRRSGWFRRKCERRELSRRPTDLLDVTTSANGGS
jgi:hypothetical protein